MPIKTDAKSALRYGRICYDIQAALSGKEWSAATLEAVAAILTENGFHVYDSDDCEGTGPRWFTSSSGAIELQMSLREAESASHQGQCDDDVAALARVPHIAAQLADIDPEDLRHELKEYGAWDETELADHAQNLQRILWLAAGEIRDRQFEES